MEKLLKKWMKKYFLLEYIIYTLLLVVPAKKLLCYRYKRKFKVEPNLEDPITYNEKLIWLMLYWDDSLAKKCADKYLVREYVEAKIGSHVLNELYQVVDEAKDIDFEKLPERFVVKSTQGCGMNFICIDKNNLTKKILLKKLKGFTSANYFYNKTREIIYKDMKPKIIIEKFLGNIDKVPKDYKIYCFNGIPFMIQVDIDRFEGSHSENYYDIEWNLLDVQDLDCPSDDSKIEDAPKGLQKMLNYARILSADFYHVRVDFYEIENEVIFGELTFSTAAGTTNWHPKEFDEILGEKFKLPLIETKKQINLN